MKIAFTFDSGTVALVTLTPRQEATIENAADIAGQDPTEVEVSLVVEDSEPITAPSAEWLEAHKRNKSSEAQS